MSHEPFDDDVYRNVHLMGIDPLLPFYDLNLAGTQGVPNVGLPALPPVMNPPTFTAPAMDMPELAPYDLTAPGIDLNDSLQIDPPDLSDYTHPYGLDVQPVPPVNQAQIDPLLPDLQHPDLTQPTQMPARPGDLATDALDVMHLSLTYQQLDAKTYPAVFLDQSGVNTTRSRHMDLLMRGLDQKEQ
ncbi:MAG: hypothetical protein H0V70_29825 [Ktedonobacteraceae bacterium]|nr:hypothetical protein [Ktedonobacteraceae bacterium]